MDVRRETRQCVCGQKIVVEVRTDTEAAEDEPRVVALYSESGAKLEQCPRCGISPSKRGPEGLLA